MQTTLRRITAACAALALLALGLVAQTPAAHAAAVLTVTSAIDGDDNGACDSPSVVQTSQPVTLRNALCVANNIGGAVSLDVPAATYELSLGPLDVGTQPGSVITISGAGTASTVIDGNGAQALVLDPHILGGVSVTLESLTIRNGSDNTFGGGAIIGGSAYEAAADSLTVRNVAFTDNTANASGSATNTVGGAIQFVGGTLTIENSTFTGNSSGTSSGGAVAYQATGASSSESLSVVSSAFANNSTGASSVLNGGSAILIDDVSQGAATLAVHDSRFEGNQSAGPGAIWVRGGTLEVLRSTFLDNIASSGAGAIHAGADATLRLHDSRLVGNTGTATLTAGASSSATDNWWGCPAGPGAAGCAVVDAPAGIVTPWLTLSATVNPVDIPFGGTSAAIDAGLGVNSAGTAIDPARLSAFTDVPVTWGTAQPAPATLTAASPVLSAGAASAIFAANGAKGAGSVTLQLDHGSMVIPVGMLYPPSFTNGENVEFTVGSAGSFTVTTDAYRAAAVAAEDGLPQGLVLTDAGDGTATIAGTPAAGEGGVHLVELSADNSVGTPAQQTLEVTVLESPGFTSGATLDTTLGASIGHTVQSDGFPHAVLTATGLPAGVQFTDLGDGTAQLSGSVTGAGNGGLYSITITAANGIGANATQVLALTVREAPAITTPPLDQLVSAGATATFTVVARGYPVPTVQWHRSTDGGASFSPIPEATALTYSELTTASQASLDTVLRVTLSNGTGSPSTASAALVVGVAPTFTSPASTSFDAGTAGTFTVTTEGEPVSAISISGAPDWLNLVDNGDGTATLGGTAPAGSGGDHVVTLVAGNAFDPDATQPFTLTVREVPTLAPEVSHVVAAGTQFTIAVAPTIVGFPGVPSITADTALPAGISLVDLGDGTAELRGTVASGVHVLSVRATNIVGSSTQEITIIAQVAPTVTEQPESTSVVAGTEVTFTAAASGYPVPTVQWQVSLDGGTTFSNVPGATSTDLSVTTVQADNGRLYRAVFANLAGTTVAESALLTVGTPAAITSGATVGFTVGEEGTHNLTASGAPAPSFTLDSGPAWLSLVDNGDGTGELVGTPPADSGGARTAQVTAFNGFGSAVSQVVSIAIDEAATFTSAADATATVGTAVDLEITTTGGFPAPTLSFSGSLPAGLSFSAVTESGTARIVGTPAAGTGGVYPLVITAQGGDTVSSQVFTITVNDTPAVTVQPVDTRGNAGSEITFTAAASGYPSPAVQWQSSLDGGVAFANIDGATTSALVLTAAQADDGTLYRAVFTNAAGTATSSQARLTIGTGPQFTSAPEATFTVGEPGTFTVTTTATPAAEIAASGTLPEWLTFTSGGSETASLSGTPTAGSGGTYTVDLTAGNGFGSDAVQRLVLTVEEAPAIVASGSHTFLVGSAGSVTFGTTAGFPVPALTVIGTLPDGLAFTDHGDGSASISGTPSVSGAGATSVTVRASNGLGTPADLALALVVNRATEVTSDPLAVRVIAGQAAHFSATAVGYPAPSVQWQRSSDDGATWAKVPGATASDFSFTAAQADDGALLRAVFSGLGTEMTSAARLTVGTPPAVTSEGFLRVGAGSSATWTISTTGAPAAAVSIVGAPAWLAFTDNGDGSGTMVATPALSAAGSYQVEVRASNGFGSDAVQQLTIEVAVAPVITGPADAAVTVGDATTLSFVATPGVPAATVLTMEGTLPAGLSFSDAGGGTATLSGTPAAGGGGVYELTIVASNAAGLETRVAFTLTVGDVAEFTSADTAEFERGIDSSFRVTTVGAHPGPVTLRADGLPAGLTFTDNGDGTAVISGALALPVSDSVVVTLRASNPTGFSEQRFTLTTRAVAPLALPATLPFATGTLFGVPASVASGADFIISGSGFAPFSPITLGLYSTPQQLGVLTADAAGTFSARIELPAGVTGRHHLVALGVAGDGTQHALVSAISIAQAAAPGGVLPVTGSDSSPLGSAAGAAMVLVGLMLLGAARLGVRRRSRAR